MKKIGGWSASILGVLVIVIALVSPASAAPLVPAKKSAYPKGSVLRLGTGEWIGHPKLPRVICDVRPGTPNLMRPGSKLSGPALPKGTVWFVPLRTQAAHLQKKASKRKLKKPRKRALRREAQRLSRVVQQAKGGCKTSSDVDPDPTPDPVPGPDAVRFNFRNASAVAQLTKPTTRSTGLRANAGGSGLVAWGQNEAPFDPLTTGELDYPIMMMAVAPDNDLIFVTDGVFVNGQCKLLRADHETGAVSCMSFDWATYPDRIRFDAAGNAYFWATGISTPGYPTTFKRVTPSGTASDVIDPAVVANLIKTVPQSGSIGDINIPFDVSPNGDVLIVVGDKLRRIKPDGSPEVIWNAEATLCGSSDGKLFVTSGGRMFTYTSGASSLDQPAWIGPPGSGATHLTTEIANNSWTPSCFSEQTSDGSLIGPVAGRFVTDDTPEGEITYLDTWTSPIISLVEYYPTPSRLDFAVAGQMSNKYFGIQTAGSRLIVSRKDLAGNFAIDIYDHASDSFETALAPTGDIEVLHMSYSPGDDLIYFDGVDFGTFRNFLGTIDPETGERRFLDNLDGDLGEIFTFG